MRDLFYELWEPVIGLEIHVQLNTKSKLFSPAPNHFGDEPNTNISVVCTGQPGALPVLNKEALRKAIQFGLAIKGKIARVSRFDRKCYFYPDTPRNFQITQFHHPIIREGTITADVEGITKTFTIQRAQLEDDAGMLKHFTQFAGVDFNRAGAPLIEIVSDPCMHSAKEASAYAQAIRTLMLYLDVTDGNMEEGSLRIDVNVSVRLKGEKTLRPRIEIKNMNSFHFLEMAIEAEATRQIDLYTANPHRPHIELIQPGTYRFDSDARKVTLMRHKESAEDYRYFPEPDLVPIVLTQEMIDSIASTLPELPHDRFRRYINDLGLSPYNACLLINDKGVGDYFEEALLTSHNAQLLCNWITVEFIGRFKDSDKTLLTSGILPQHIAKLTQLIEENKITGRIAKSVADEMVSSPGTDPASIVAHNPDYQPLGSLTEIESLVDKVLQENPQSVADFKAGREKAFAFLVGQVMKNSRGKAPPHLVNDLLKKKLF
jgi:aspartyl-tRNA(Asn)/glutamyl-tRNA(Gln) amidotransferase subunit B